MDTRKHCPPQVMDGHKGRAQGSANNNYFLPHPSDTRQPRARLVIGGATVIDSP
jgi:hypothetical protein